MDADRWNTIERVFDAALDRPPEERAAFLDDACGGDDALRNEVEALLAADANPPPFLEEDAAAAAAPLLAGDDAVAPVPDTQVGPYRLIEQIGEGGMSVVYRAERADGHFDQHVALKLLPRYFETDRRRARFRAERQILADLEHPNIAGLLDGGVTDAGRPYLVMEYVDGAPITMYCATHDLPLDARLNLLQAVCRAVQHAHQRLVVHRDLKPGNILVTDTDEGPRVKLLDFGIAKLLDPTDTTWTRPMTRTGEHWMTPEYAAPEQVRGGAITTATDVYQLGVLAYELLTYERPFDVSGKPLTEVERIIVETTPARPSTALQSYMDEAGTEAARPTEPKAWRRLRGDLDTIVMKALRKEPERRYSSAEAFADDLDRFLNGHPVHARPATVRYRMQKFVQRHRTGVTLATAAAVLLVAFVAALAYQRTVAVQERDRAAQEADKAEQVSAFLVSLFESNAPEEARGDTVTARELLNRGIARAEALDDQPLVQAQMFSVIGEVRRAYGNYASADSLLSRALQIRRDQHDGPHPEVVQSARELAVLRMDQGAFEAADSLLQSAIDMLRALHDGPHAELAIALSDRSTLHSQQGNYTDAEALAQEALAMRRALFDPPHEAIAAGLNNLAAVYYRLNRLGEAAPLYEESLAMYRELLGEDHPRVATLLNNLANLYDSLDQLDKAERYRRQTLALDRKLFGTPHRYVASDLASLGSILSSKGDHEEAISVVREAVAMQRELLGNDHPDVATALDVLGRTLVKADRHDEAEAVLRESLALRRERFNSRHPRLVNTLNALGTVCRATARYDEAVAHYREAIAIQRETVGNSGRKLAVITSNLGGALGAQNQWADAEAAYRQSLTLYQSLTPYDTVGTAEAHIDLGSTLAEQDVWEEATSHLHTGRRLLESAHGADHPAVERAARLLAQAPQN
jgi:serine/threonine-protein kinase